MQSFPPSNFQRMMCFTFIPMLFSPRQTNTKTPVPSNQLSICPIIQTTKALRTLQLQTTQQVPENTYHIISIISIIPSSHHPIIPPSQCPASAHQGFELPFLGIFQFHLLGRVLAAELLDVGLQDEAASMGFGKGALREMEQIQLKVGLKYLITRGIFR